MSEDRTTARSYIIGSGSLEWLKGEIEQCGAKVIKISDLDGGIRQVVYLANDDTDPFSEKNLLVCNKKGDKC